jgi:hypothetical protein
MKMTIASTEKIVELEGPDGKIPARVWEGQTERGTPVIVFVTRIAASRDVDPGEFLAELEEHNPPTADVAAWPAKMFLD